MTQDSTSSNLTLSQREGEEGFLCPTTKAGSIDSLPSPNAAPLVDVNLITYNHEKYVAQAIESVLAQETNFRFRLIVGDDCSTDQTQAIVRDYAQKYPDRIVLHLDDQHRGLRSRDRPGLKALRLSTAKYVAWLDGDDFWTDPKKLQKQVDVLESNPDIAICFHNVSTFHQQGDAPSENLRPPDQKEVSSLEDLLKGNFIPSCSVMFRLDAIGELPEWYFTLKMGDWPLYILIARQGRIRYIDEVMAAYRVHGGGSWSPRQRTHHDVHFLQMLDQVDRHFDFKFKNEIDATRSRYYFELAESYYERGHPKRALVPIKRGLRSSRFRHRGLISFYLQVKAPHIYNSLRNLRNILRPQRSDSPGVIR